MDRRRSLTLAYAVYLIVRVLVCMAQMVPLRAALALAGPLGWLVYAVNRRHRLVALENVRHAFPEMTAAEADALVRATYRHFVEVMIEVALLPRVIRRDTVGRHVECTGRVRDVIEAAKVSGRPMLVLTGHFGNWEVMNFGLGLMGMYAHAVARPLDNPYLDAFFRRLRCMTGQKVIDKAGAYFEMRDVLDRRERVAIVCDQDAGPKGFFVEFFGRPASTFKPPALLALEHDAPIVVGAAVRVGPMRFELRVSDLIDPREYAGRPDAALEVTRRYTRALEALVREAPEQYFWLHRRWKHQPRARAAA